ncbi:hypothetical protein [Mongoliimonas terrestris]|uniref:hypothetical protein n=1 Tax=Mongoliimonas terrestris TaxID=1709001 RepID=UPI0009496F6C|nr:hypothetical protein [Mongoliimonas terrestris]
MTSTGLPWVRVVPGVPAFETEDGAPFVPIGHNDALSWVDLSGLYRRRDVESAAANLCALRHHGVTVVRMMLECAHARHRLLESPVGRFNPHVVRFWDDLVGLAESTGLRLLLTPFDTFWTWIRWRHHAYNVENGGPLRSPHRLLVDPGARAAIKNRLSFAVRRWGGSGAIFGWDLWNEIHPAMAEESADVFPAFIADLSGHVRRLELDLYGRSHPQTVSLFGPELWWRPHMPLEDPIFRHPDLDFSTIHIYREGTIDDPRDTVAPALDMGSITADCVGKVPPDRPFLDTEHGPIHRFKDKKKALPEPFDDEYFRHMQWAHLAAGGAGGGMRWPNRHPHRLTDGMRQAQAVLSAFCALVDWQQFRRVVVHRPEPDTGAVAAFATGDRHQAVVWAIRRDTIGPDGRLDAAAPPIEAQVLVPTLEPGRYRVRLFDTRAGVVVSSTDVTAGPDGLTVVLAGLRTDLAAAVARLP